MFFCLFCFFLVGSLQATTIIIVCLKKSPSRFIWWISLVYYLFLQFKQYYEIGILYDLAPPTVLKCNTTVVNTDLRSVIVIRHNVGANYRQNSLHPNKCYVLQLVSWCKHVCNAVIRPSHWSYTEQKQVMGGRVAETETPFTLLQDTVPSKSFWSCYFKVKTLQAVA